MNSKDNINKEYEARVMINKNQYSSIIKSYKSKGFKLVRLTNVNYYFDTPKRYLTERGMVLRVRKINHFKYELTLKIKSENYDLEVNTPLTYKQSVIMLKHATFTSTQIKDKLKEAGVDINDLKLITKLKTKRIEIKDKNDLFVIDKNYFNKKVDYNLEVESASKLIANSYLNKIIEEFNIENKKDYISKSRRAIYNL